MILLIVKEIVESTKASPTNPTAIDKIRNVFLATIILDCSIQDINYNQEC